MRIAALGALVMLTACGGAAEAPKAKAGATELAAGEWTTNLEVTRVTVTDGDVSALKLAVGDKAEIKSCVGPGEGKRPPATLLVGEAAGECTYESIYLSRGRLNAGLQCRKEGLSGRVMPTVSGTYTADSVDATATITTVLSTPGDSDIEAKVTAKRTGDCSSETASPEKA